MKQCGAYAEYWEKLGKPKGWKGCSLPKGHKGNHQDEKIKGGLNGVQECPHIKRKRAGDESWDFCELTERPSGRIKPCLLVSNGKCETWEKEREELDA